MTLREIRMSDFLDRSGEMVPVQVDGCYRTAGIRSFGKGIFERGTISGSDTKYSALWRISAGQLVFSKLFAWEGAVALAEPPHDGLLFSSEFPMFDIDESILLPEYAAYLVRWTGLHERLRGNTTGVGNRRQRVNPDSFLATTVPLPDIDVQSQYVSKLQTAFAGLAELVARRQRLEAALSPSLLNAAFSGQL